MTASALLPPEAIGLASAPFGSEAPLYEVVDGCWLEVLPMSAYAAKIASRLARRIGDHAEAGGLGEAVVETLFRLPLVEDRARNRRPDVAFVSSQRWPAGTPQPVTANAWDVVPDLAVEIISPNDGMEDLVAKVAEYFRAGVRLVWVVLPVLRQVYVYEAPTTVGIVTDAEALDGGAVLPGFLLPMGNLLDPPPPPIPAA